MNFEESDTFRLYKENDIILKGALNPLIALSRMCYKFLTIDITKSGTRREELIFDKDDLQKMNVLRRIIAPMGTMDAIEFINSKLKNTKNNADFFDSMNKTS